MRVIIDKGGNIGALIGAVLYGVLLVALLYMTIKRKQRGGKR